MYINNKIRKLKNKNGNLQIQVVEKIDRQNKVVRHLGTAKNELEVNELVNLAKQFIENQRIKARRISLFDNRYSTSGMAMQIRIWQSFGIWQSI